jgi:hypothetical protein
MNAAPPEPRGLPVIRAADLAAAPQTPPWLIEPLWAAAGVGVLGGSPKSGKTWLGLELAVAVASATPCLDRFPVRTPGAVLVYLAEDALHVVRDRLAALAAHRRLPLERLDLHVITAASLRLDDPADLRRLDETIAALRPRLLLLDPFVRLHKSDENNAQEVAAILDRLRTLQRTFEVAIVLVHHTRKNGARGRDGQALRGSGDLWAWGDSNLYLMSQQGRLRLSIEHRAAPAPDPLTLRLVPDPPHLALAEPVDDPEPKLPERIAAELQRAGAPLTRTLLRQRLAVNNQRLGVALEQLQAAGRLRHTEDGWAL